jgi:hypothetical protein
MRNDRYYPYHIHYPNEDNRREPLSTGAAPTPIAFASGWRLLPFFNHFYFVQPHAAQIALPPLIFADIGLMAATPAKGQLSLSTFPLIL